MKATKFVLTALATEGATHIFMVPGGLVDPFYEELGSASGITPIVAAHEGGAAYMADGYARASGRFGACLCIGGPGVTNVVTALSAANTDNSPVIVISGEVPSDWEGRGSFQDASSVGLNDIEVLRPLTSYSTEVENIHLLNHHLKCALQQMLTTPKLPVHLSIPKDVQQMDIEHEYQPLFGSVLQPRLLDGGAMGAMWNMLASPKPAAKIAILAGHGVTSSGAGAQLKQLGEKYKIPIATTLKAKGVVSEDSSQSVGIFGYAGTRHATDLLLSDECEVLLVLGSGMDQRDTMFWSKKLKPKRALVQVDMNPAALGRNYPVDLGIVGDCLEFIKALMNADATRTALFSAGTGDRVKWLEMVRASGPLLYDEETTKSDAVPMHPARVVKAARAAMPQDTVVLVDSGAHRAFAGHFWRSYGPGQYISATNVGPMGWAIPAAIGAKLARPELPTMVITGDGCMLMHGIEIQTAARYGLPIIFLIINNSALGNVYLRASKVGPEGKELTILPTHDWVMFARALGADGVRVDKPAELAGAFRQALASAKPFVIDARCDRECGTPVAPWKQATHDWVDDG